MKLFQPAMIGNVMLINRIVMSPMGTGGIIDPSGRFSQRAIDYYVARARGGAGLLISGMTRVETQIEERRENVYPANSRLWAGCGPRYSQAQTSGSIGSSLL